MEISKIMLLAALFITAMAPPKETLLLTLLLKKPTLMLLFLPLTLPAINQLLSVFKELVGLTSQEEPKTGELILVTPVPSIDCTPGKEMSLLLVFTPLNGIFCSNRKMI